MEDLDLPFTEPIASTSRAVLTLPYKSPPTAPPTTVDPFAIDPRRLKLFEKHWNRLNFKIQQTLSSLHDESLNEIVQFVLDSNRNDQKGKGKGQEEEEEFNRFEMYKILTTQESSSKSKNQETRELLKTGLILGVSSGSSSLVYNSLIKQLTTATTKDKGKGKLKSKVLVSRLNSRECGGANSIKNCLRSIIGGFIGSGSGGGGDTFEPVEEEEEDDDDDEVLEEELRKRKTTTTTTSKSSSLMVPEDLNNLLHWYKQKFNHHPEEERGDPPGPTLVILLEDLESIPGKTLNQVILTLSHYTNKLPLVLLLGIQTTPEQSLYNLLPLSSTVHERLDLKSFKIDSGIKTFNLLIKNCFINHHHHHHTLDDQDQEEEEGGLLLGIGPRGYREMFKSFQDLNGSIDGVINFLQLSYMNHFISSPLALLLLLLLEDDQPSNNDDQGGIVSEEELKDLIKNNEIPSLKGETESISLDKIRQLLNEFKSRERMEKKSQGFEVLIGMVEFWGKEKKFPIEVCLNLVLGGGGGGDSDNSGRGGQGQGQGQGGGLNKMIDELCGLVLNASSTKLPQLLKTLINRLSSISTTSSRTSGEIQDFLTDRLQSLNDKVLSKPKPRGRTNLINLHLNNVTASSNNNSMGLGAGGAGGGGGIEEIDREFSKIAKQVSEGLRDRLKEALKPCTEMKGYEIFHCDDNTSISKRLNPTPLPTILKTLSKLDQRPDDHSSEAQAQEEEAMPLDLAISFRIYKELNCQGRLINLGDWWSGFELSAGDEPSTTSTSTRSPSSSSKKNKKRKRHSQPEEEKEDEQEEEEEEEEEDGDGDGGKLRRKQARFLRTVADLSHLGFVGPSTRKPEHLVKYVY